jgi:hypothetical protein
MDMSEFARCAALLRNGQPCGRTVSAGVEFCIHHTKLLETVDAESLREGRIPKKRALKDPPLRLVMEPPEPSSAEAGTAVTNADPATVRPSLAIAAAENVEALKESLLQAAAAATKPTWITVECSGCGEQSRIEAPVPDVRTRVAAIELLLREGLGRPATAEDAHSRQMPTNVAAVREMTWDDIQALFAAIEGHRVVWAENAAGRSRVRAVTAP